MPKNDQNNMNALILGVGLLIFGMIALGLALTQDWPTLNAVAAGLLALGMIGAGIYMIVKGLNR